jgi:anti-sigma factor RsiW
MRQVQPEELSALIDGELDAQRAAEVERQIAADGEMQAEFETLRNLDVCWRSLARTEAFIPVVRLSKAHPQKGWTTLVAVTVVAMIVRIAPRLIGPTTLSFAFEALALFMVLACVARLAWIELKPAVKSAF